MRVGVLLCLLLVGVLTTAAVGGAAASDSEGLIAYWSDEPFPTLWTIRPDGSERRRILRTQENAKRPALSPDRKWIAFDRTPAGKPLFSDFDLQVVRLDGTGRRTLTSSLMWDTDAQWSPNGQLLSFSRLPPNPRDEHQASIWIIRRDGTQARRLARGFGGRWSPDGTKLVYEAPTRGGEANLSVISVRGGRPRPLLTSRGTEQPAGWSRDGKWILFTRYDDANHPSVFVVGVNGRRLTKLAAGIAGSWSPDGSKIVYVSSFQGPLFIMNRDGSHKRRVTPLPSADPTWR